MQSGLAAFGEYFCGGAGDGGEKPIESIFASHEFKLPTAIFGEKFFMALGNSQNFIDGVHPIERDRFLANQRGENLAQTTSEMAGFREEGVGRLRVGLWKRQQLGAAFWRNDSGDEKEFKQGFPGEILGGRVRVGEVYGQPTTDKVGSMRSCWHRIHLQPV